MPGAVRSKDGRAFVRVSFWLASQFEGVEGADLVERARTSATRRYERKLGQRLTGVELVPFESARAGTWKWKAAPVRHGEGYIRFPTKIIVDLGRDDAVVEISAGGNRDNEDLVRRIIETLRVTSYPKCYWETLETLLKTVY